MKKQWSFLLILVSMPLIVFFNEEMLLAKSLHAASPLTADFSNSDSFRQIKKSEVTVIDPNEQIWTVVPGSEKNKFVAAVYLAYDGLNTLDKLFGSRTKWVHHKALRFTCADGYQPELPTTDFLNGGFHFAFAKKDGLDFSIVNQLKDGKRAALGPIYLIWTTAEKQTKESSHFWPYQLKAVALVK